LTCHVFAFTDVLTVQRDAGSLDSGPSSTIIISAGSFHTCTLVNGTKSGVVCWGKNDNGQLGIGKKMAMEAQYLAIVDLGDG
jgi:alpha-tubulin suppressor-like RCC1 family protein